jgi:hypothetical protein
MVAITDALVPAEKQAAKERQKEHGGTAPGRKHLRKIPASEREPTAIDHVAKAVGKARKTLVKARAVVEAAKAEPEKFGELKAAMDRSGKVDGAYKKLTKAKHEEKIAVKAKAVPAASERYRRASVSPASARYA